ncbi:MAG: hypothetical protein KC464_35725, partial [Myxococcales bacterium]|nr:hypothetical protein [Myxococcales bacterium]
MSLLGTQLLENLLRAEPGAFDRLLRAHGPVVPGEVDLLAERARDSSARVRHNATVLLGIARAPDRDAVLRVLARDTSDPVVLVLAARALPDGAAIAATRPALLKAAEDAD